MHGLHGGHLAHSGSATGVGRPPRGAWGLGNTPSTPGVRTGVFEGTPPAPVLLQTLESRGGGPSVPKSQDGVGGLGGPRGCSPGADVSEQPGFCWAAPGWGSGCPPGEEKEKAGSLGPLSAGRCPSCLGEKGGGRVAGPAVGSNI